MTQPINNTQNAADGASIGRIAYVGLAFGAGMILYGLSSVTALSFWFKLRRMKQNTLVSTLDAETFSHVSNIILSPPATDKYKIVYERLISEFSDFEHQNIRKLLTELLLGDGKPSHLLRKIKKLSGGQLQDEFLKNLWLQLLPSPI